MAPRSIVALIFQLVIVLAPAAHAAATEPRSNLAPSVRQSPMTFLSSSKHRTLSEDSLLRFRELSRMAGLDVILLLERAGHRASFQAAAVSRELKQVIFVSVDHLVNAEHDGNVSRLSSIGAGSGGGKGSEASINRGAGSAEDYFVSLSLGTQRASVAFVGFTELEVKSAVQNYRAQYAASSSAASRLPASEALVPVQTSASSPAEASSSVLERATLDCLHAAGEGIGEPFVGAFKSAQALARDPDQWIENSKAELRQIQAALVHLAQNFKEVTSDAASEAWNKAKNLTTADINRMGCKQAAAFVSGTMTALSTKGVLNVLAPPVGIRGVPQLQVEPHPKAKDWPVAQKALADLKAHLGSADIGHKLTIKNGRGYVKIGYLKKEHAKFMQLLARAIRSGAIAELDTGSIVGPKGLVWVNHLSKMEPKTGELIRFKGSIDVSKLEATKRSEVAMTPKVADPANPEHWRPSDLADYDQAIKDFNIKQGCAAHFGSASLNRCGVLVYELESPRTRPIRWEQGIRIGP